jgi:serine/threonine protein kinase
MSPEQARGEEVDARSDQFSFGLIVYELAARKRAFARPSAAETMAAIIRDEAEPLPPSVPAPVRWVVERCLAKDPAERYDSTRDLYRELKHAREHLSEASGSGSQAGVGKPAMRHPRWRVCPAMPDQSSYRFTPFSFAPGGQFGPLWSPDGKAVAYAAPTDPTRPISATWIPPPRYKSRTPRKTPAQWLGRPMGNGCS